MKKQVRKLEEYSRLVPKGGSVVTDAVDVDISGSESSSSVVPMEISAVPSPGTKRGGNDGSGDGHHSRSWKYATVIIVGEIVGSGILGLPFAMKNLGWIFGFLASPIFGAWAMYSGLLLSRARNRYPRCSSYADLAQVLVGRKFALFTQFGIALNWIALLPYFLVAASDAMLIVFDAVGFDICFYQISFVVALILIVPLQRRSLHGLTRMTFLSDVSILLAIVLMLGDFAANRNDSARTTTFPPRVGFLEGYMGISSFLFAFQGQSMFLEIMSEMRNPGEFTKASTVANVVMVVLYALASCWTYACLGDDVEDFMPDSVRSPAIRAMVGLLLSYHIMCSYMLTHQPLAMQIYRIVHEGNDMERTISTPSRKDWAVVVCCLLIFSYTVANVIPFFVSLQGIIGSALGAPIMFGWPPLFYFLSVGGRLSAFDRAMCGFFFFVLLPFCSIAGTIAAIDDMAKRWADGRSGPFGCGGDSG